MVVASVVRFSLKGRFKLNFFSAQLVSALKFSALFPHRKFSSVAIIKFKCLT